MKPLSVYLHLPFCEKRCGYCDFVSCCDLPKIDVYLTELCAEIRAFDFAKYEVKTIYLGGGTPSLLSPTQIKKIFQVLPPCQGEITIEANPNSLTAEKCETYRAVGINRISIGVQSFDDQTLQALGRLHNVKQAVDAVELASKYFANISIDLIKDIPNHKFVQPPLAVLDKIKHISVYSLTRDDKPVMDTDEKVHLPQAFTQYEVSNYARQSFASQHNMTYWTGGDYVGFGSGAHSLLDKVRFNNSPDIPHYHRENCYTLTAEQQRQEKIMLGLRLATGFNKNLLVGKDDELAMLQKNGFVKIVGDQIVATAKGQQLLNQLWLKLT